MKRNAVSTGLKSLKSDVLIVGCYQGELEKASTIKQLNGAGNGALTRFAAAGKFHRQERRDAFPLRRRCPGRPHGFARRSGRAREAQLTQLESALIKAFRAVRQIKKFRRRYFRSALTLRYVRDAPGTGRDVSTYAGMLDYRINHQKTAKLRFAEPAASRACVWSPAGRSAKTRSAVGLGLHNSHAIADAVNLARDLSNEPAKDCTPQRLAAKAQSNR